MEAKLKIFNANLVLEALDKSIPIPKDVTVQLPNEFTYP